MNNWKDDLKESLGINLLKEDDLIDLLISTGWWNENWFHYNFFNHFSDYSCKDFSLNYVDAYIIKPDSYGPCRSANQKLDIDFYDFTKSYKKKLESDLTYLYHLTSNTFLEVLWINNDRKIAVIVYNGVS